MQVLKKNKESANYFCLWRLNLHNFSNGSEKKLNAIFRSVLIAVLKVKGIENYSPFILIFSSVFLYNFYKFSS